MKKTNWHASSTGTTAQNKLRESFESLGLRYTQEDIAISTRTANRSKGKYDFVVHLKEYDHMIECKSNSTSITIPNTSNKNPNIKTHQLSALREAISCGHKAGLMLNFRTADIWVYMSIKQLDTMVFNEPWPLNAITVKLGKKYGTVVDVSDSGKLVLKRIL